MTYTKKDIIRIIPGLKPNQVKYYTEAGIISIDTEGTGHYRRYSAENVCEFAIIFELSTYGMPASQIKETLSSCKTGLEEYGLKLTDIPIRFEFPWTPFLFVVPNTAGIPDMYWRDQSKKSFITVSSDEEEFYRSIAEENGLQMYAKSYLQINLRIVLTLEL